MCPFALELHRMHGLQNSQMKAAAVSPWTYGEGVGRSKEARKHEQLRLMGRTRYGDHGDPYLLSYVSIKM